jgi:bidirectional [NiFe] hydrogenase diaphorase subunit
MDLFELLEIAESERKAQKEIRICVCVAAGCLSANAQEVINRLKATVEETGLKEKVDVVGVGCMGLCSEGPLVRVEPQGLLYAKVTPDDAPSIVTALKGGKAKPKLADTNHPFFALQKPIVLENSGRIDPEKIESYIAHEGYLSLYRVLHELKPADVVNAITKSGLRGRGGAGYPTGVKWGLVAKVESDKKFVVCNADEGDPGAFMDRSILESDPHKIIEGMSIAAYAIGASQGYIYVRGEYPLAIARLQTAIRQAKKLGLMGMQVFESSFNFRIDLRLGAGAFVCGEETALIASIEGKRGQPRPKPPFPSQSGLWGQPTVINNVETFANVAPIIRNGPNWFAKIGTEKSKGTKVFALAGNIQNTGLIEVPMGTTLRQIVEEMGGGVPNKGKVKAVQAGGPSGGCIPASALETPVDYESLVKVGSMMGSGGMIVMDENTNMVNIAKFFMEFCKDESCGKCIPCRAGTVQLYRMLLKISEGKGTKEDITKMQELCDLVRETSLCGLGQSSPNPVRSTLKHFYSEYEALLQDEELSEKKK